MKDSTFWKWYIIVCGTLLAAWRNIPHAEQALLTLMGIDLAMGVLAALIRGEFSAKTLLMGILKKAGILLFLLSTHVVESLLIVDVEFDIDKWTAYALCMYEMTSLVESYVRLGGQVPPIVRKFLEAINKVLEDKGVIDRTPRATLEPPRE